VKYWTVHLAAARPPVLLRDGFSWGALLFGPFWLLRHGAWIPAGLSFAAFVLTSALLPENIAGFVTLGLMLLHGLSGHDMRAWALEQRGFTLTHVLTGRRESDALARLLDNRPDLRARTADL
jgi:Protein of unknown function (DUF2628)